MTSSCTCEISIVTHLDIWNINTRLGEASLVLKFEIGYMEKKLKSHIFFNMLSIYAYVTSPEYLRGCRS